MSLGTVSIEFSCGSISRKLLGTISPLKKNFSQIMRKELRIGDCCCKCNSFRDLNLKFKRFQLILDLLKLNNDYTAVDNEMLTQR